MTTEYAYCQSTSAPLAGVGPHKGSHGKPCLIVAVRGTPPLRLGRLECGLLVLPGSSMKTPKVGLGYHPFKRVVMRCRARDEKRQEMSLPVTNPGLMESSRKGRRCAGERKPGCSWNCTCRTWVLAPTGCMRKGDPFGIRNQVRAGTNTLGFPLVLTCLRSDARRTPTMTRKPKSRHLTPPRNRSKYA